MGSVEDLRTRALYAVMYDCGLRFGEAVNLLWDNGNMDLANRQINIINRNPQKDIPHFYIKDYEARSVYCTARVMVLLKELEKRRSKSNPFVFLSNDRFERVKANWITYQEEGKQDEWLNIKRQ